MLNCREATELCSRELEQRLALGQRVSLRAHLLMCSGCSQFRRQVSALREAAHAYAQGLAVPTEADPREGR